MSVNRDQLGTDRAIVLNGRTAYLPGHGQTRAA